MMISDFNLKLNFHNEMRNFHHGQSDMTLFALLNGERVGYINYSKYKDDSISIQYIEVIQKYRNENRRGIGTALVKHLQSMYPDTEIEWGMTTPDGSALKASLPTKVVYNPLYQEYLNKLKKIEELEKKYTEIFENKKTTQEKKLELGIKWNHLHDLEYTLKQKLMHLSASKTLIEL